MEKGHGDCSWLLSAHREAVFRKGSYPVDWPIGRLLGWGIRSEQQTGTPNLGAAELVGWTHCPACSVAEGWGPSSTEPHSIGPTAENLEGRGAVWTVG